MGWVSFAGAAANFNTTSESFGRTGLTGTTVTSGGGAATKGSWAQLNSTGTGNALANSITDLEIFFQIGPGTSSRFMVDIGVGESGAQTVLIENMWCIPSTNNVKGLIFRGLNIAAGTKVWARCSHTAATQTLQVHGRGLIRTSDMAPGYNSIEQIYPSGASLTNTVPNTADVTMVTTAGTGWTQWVASSAREYKAFAFNIGLASTTTLPTTNQNVMLRMAEGAGNTLFYEHIAFIQAANPMFFAPLLTTSHHTVAASTKLSVEILAGTAGANDIAAPQIWGMW